MGGTQDLTAEHIAEVVAADVAAAVKADERYAPLIAALADRVLGELAPGA